MWRGAKIRCAERVTVEDVAGSPIFADSLVRDAMLEAGALSVQSTPIFGRSGRLIGMLSTHCHAVGRPGQRQLRLLDLLAHHAGRNIERVLDGPRAATGTGSSDDRERSAALICRSLYLIQRSGTLLRQSDERIGKSQDVIAISKHILWRAPRRASSLMAPPDTAGKPRSVLRDLPLRPLDRNAAGANPGV